MMGINVDVHRLAKFDETDICSVCLINSKKTLEGILAWKYYFDIQDEDKVVHEDNWVHVDPKHFDDVIQDYRPRRANMEAINNKKILVQWKAPYPYRIEATHAFLFHESDWKLLVLIDFHQKVSAFGLPLVDDDGNKNWGPMFTIQGPFKWED